MKVLLYLVSVTIVLFIFSCESQIGDKEIKGMIKFNTQEEYLNTLSEVVKMTGQELKEFEEEHGFSSFGAKSEAFYRNIDMESFNSVDEIKKYVLDNSHYLQLIDDGNGELELETQYYNRPYRYFQNEDNMYQVEDIIYKVFDTGIVTGNYNEIELFGEYGNDLDKYKSDNQFDFIVNENLLLKSTNASCNPSEPFRSTNGRERLKVEIEVYNPYITQKVTAHFISRPYKRTLGIWYWKTRNMSVSMHFVYSFIYFEDCSSGYGQCSNTFKDALVFMAGWSNTNKYEKTISTTKDFVMQDSKMITKYTVWADTDKVDYILEACNN